MDKHLPMATRKLKARLNIEEQQPWGPPLGKKKMLHLNFFSEVNFLAFTLYVCMN